MNILPARLLYSLVCASLLSALVGIEPAYAAGLVVNSSADTIATDAFCTLREAITNANDDATTYPDCASGSGADTITFAGNYTITLAGSQLPVVTTAITIKGKGTGNTILQANANPNTATNRIFDVSDIGNLTIDNLTVRNGRCEEACPTDEYGGGLLNNGMLAITNSTLSANTSGNGGAVTNYGTLTVTNSTFSDNSATGAYGGGIYTRGPLTVTNSTFSANSANHYGGGIYNSSGSTTTVTNSTFFANSTSNFGGGIYTWGPLTVTNSTFSANSGRYGGGIQSFNTTTTLYNTIVANSLSGPDCSVGLSSSGGIIADSHNLDTDGTCDNATQSTSAQINLQPLANNGGPTQTMALGSGSVALNTGNAAVCANAPVSGKDQRGVSRLQGAGCDVGAYELDNTYPTVVSNSLVASYTSGPNDFMVTFSENVYDPEGSAGADDVTNPANYLLVEAGVNGVFNTTSCAGGRVADDTQIAVNSVTYDSATFTSTVNINGGTALPAGEYRLFVCGTTSIVDIALNPLNNGTSDYTFDFVVTPPPVTPSPPPASAALPDTGFAPNRITSLSDQSASTTYTALGSIWLEIPSQNVKTNIVGVPKSGNSWDVTWLGDDIGWLSDTAFPTWEGNSVITGHVYNANGLPGPFMNLKNLKYGDRIIVHLYGQKYVFEVQASRLVNPGINSYAFQHLEDSSYLTLITCQGYDEQSEFYRFRRIVRAVLVSVQSE